MKPKRPERQYYTAAEVLAELDLFEPDEDREPEAVSRDPLPKSLTLDVLNYWG